MKNILLAVICGFIISCAQKHTINLNSDVLVIGEDELTQYWVYKDDTFQVFMLNEYMPKNGISGYVKIQYIIDSNGNVFNPKIIESQPEGIFDSAGLLTLSNIKYIASEFNKEHIPVQHILRVDIKSR